MSEVLDLLSSELDEKKIREIAKHLDADESQTEAAIAAALPTLISAIGRHSETEQGAAMISQQIQGIGGGSLGDLLGSLLGGQQRSGGDPAAVLPRPPSQLETKRNRPRSMKTFCRMDSMNRSALADLPPMLT